MTTTLTLDFVRRCEMIISKKRVLSAQETGEVRDGQQ